MDDFVYRGGALFGEDVELHALADRVGTPTYVYSASTIRGHYERIEAAFASVSPLICFSLKSAGNLHLARLLASMGAGMDVVSGGELERAFLAGCPMDRVVFAGVGKTGPEIAAALDGSRSLLAGSPGFPDPTRRGPIGWFNVESRGELGRLSDTARELGVIANGALRVNPDVDAGTHAAITTGVRQAKFGVGIEDAPALFREARGLPGARLTGLHMHLGSAIRSTDPYVTASRRLLDLAAELERDGQRIESINVGGGFGADYITGSSLSFASFGAALEPLLQPWARRGTRILLEPGRAIIATAGVLLTRVIDVKRNGGKEFVIADAGMNALIRPSLYDAFHFIWPARVDPLQTPPARSPSPPLPGLRAVDVVGPICESGDFLARQREMPPVKPGDVLAVFSAGAYGMSMASTYNARPLPAEVLLDGSSARVIRPRQRVADLVRAEWDLLPNDPAHRPTGGPHP